MPRVPGHRADLPGELKQAMPRNQGPCRLRRMVDPQGSRGELPRGRGATLSRLCGGSSRVSRYQLVVLQAPPTVHPTHDGPMRRRRDSRSSVKIPKGDHAQATGLSDVDEPLRTRCPWTRPPAAGERSAARSLVQLPYPAEPRRSMRRSPAPLFCFFRGAATQVTMGASPCEAPGIGPGSTAEGRPIAGNAPSRTRRGPTPAVLAPRRAEPGGVAWSGLLPTVLHGSPRMYYSPYPTAYLSTRFRAAKPARGRRSRTRSGAFFDNHDGRARGPRRRTPLRCLPYRLSGRFDGPVPEPSSAREGPVHPPCRRRPEGRRRICRARPCFTLPTQAAGPRAVAG